MGKWSTAAKCSAIQRVLLEQGIERRSQIRAKYDKDASYEDIPGLEGVLGKQLRSCMRWSESKWSAHLPGIIYDTTVGE